jgi:ABC-type glutathione transport system ATPase component
MSVTAASRRAADGGVLIDVVDLAKYYPVTSGVLRRVVGHVRAVDGVTLGLVPGETLALVGESGCGKSSLARTLVRLLDPTGGRITFRGQDVTAVRGGELRRFRRNIQDGLPGSVLVAQPASHRPTVDRRADAHPPAVWP